MQLIGIKEITGKIILKSGLHIGAGDMEMKIGGTDNPVIKHPHTLEPYIPGSSLKGKVRSLLEMKSGLMSKTQGAPLSASDLDKCPENSKEDCKNILKLFGSSGADEDAIAKIGPTRCSFSDAPISSAWITHAEENHFPLTEVKSENTIDRIKGTAKHPRFTERVPSGTEFDFSITLKELHDDEGLEIYLLKGLKLLQMDSLGGSGSRGYGKIELKFDDEDVQKTFDNTNPL
jgi:CRISPR-associated protein Csm3